MSYYLVILDAEIKAFDASITKYCDALSTMAGLYENTIDQILVKGVVAGSTHDALAAFQGYSKRLNEIVCDVGELYHETLTKLISDIEKADSYLYDADILSNKRDYTQELYNELQNFLEECDGEAGNFLQRLIGSAILKISDIMHLGGANHGRQWLQANYKALLAYNRECSIRLKSIFDSVHGIDAQYGSRLAEGAAILDDVKNLLIEMAAAINPKSKDCLSAKSMAKLAKSFDQLDQKCMLREDGVIAGVSMSSQMLQEFAGSSDIPGFDQFQGATEQFNNTYSGSIIQTAIMTVVNLDEGFQDAWTQFVLNNTSTIGIQGIENLTYEEYLEFSQMMESLEFMKNSSGIQKKAKKYEKLLKDIGGEVSDVKDFAKKVNEYLKDDPEAAAVMKEFCNTLSDNARFIEFFGGQTADALPKILAELETERAILKSLEKSAQGTSAEKTVTLMKRIYDRKWTYLGEQWTEGFSEWSYDNLISKPLKTFTKTVSTIGKVTGLGEQYEAAYEARKLEMVTASSEEVYRNSIAELRKADPNDKDHYYELKENVVYAFRLHQTNMERMYTEMAKALTGPEKAYYEYCATEVRKLNMSTNPESGIMSYDEFISQDLGRTQNGLKPPKNS